MGNFKIIPHTADIRLRAEGETSEDLFNAALAGMGAIIRSGACEDPRAATVRRDIEVSSTDITALLVDFLSEVLTLTQLEKTVFCRARFRRLDGRHLQGTVFGEKVGGFDEDIKAVTYHEADVEKNAEGNLETSIVFDI